MLPAANCERFLTALVETTFKLGSLRLWLELRHNRLLKLMGTAGGFTCFNPKVTWSTDNCLRSIFLLSLAGLSFKSIDFCFRNKFFALLGWIWIGCRKVDIFRLHEQWRNSTKKEELLLFSQARKYVHVFYCNSIMYCWCLAIFTSFMQIFTFSPENQTFFIYANTLHTRKSC